MTLTYYLKVVHSKFSVKMFVPSSVVLQQNMYTKTYVHVMAKVKSMVASAFLWMKFHIEKE